MQRFNQSIEIDKFLNDFWSCEVICAETTLIVVARTLR